MSVIITNANRRVGLYSIRALGKAGIDVAATEVHGTCKKPIGFQSRYCKKSFWTPPTEDERSYIKFMLKISEKYDVLIPCLTDAMEPISKYLPEFKGQIEVPILEYNRLKNALDKATTYKLAKDNGIPIPFTFTPRKIEDLYNIPQDVYPLVIKFRKRHASGVAYVDSFSELKEKYIEMHKIEAFPIVQEYIPGKGVGFFALFNKDGKVRATFTHRRIREYPITGGISAFCESIENSTVHKYGLRLLRAMDWYGVAMVEFRVDSRDGVPKLMEINPRFWGSMALAIQAGVNFPLLLYKIALEGDVRPIHSYKIGVKTRFLFTDLLACYQRLKSERNKLKVLYDFIQPFFDKNVEDGVLSLDDPKPSIQYIWDRIHSKIGKKNTK
jgi:predicted ATP-grasp superfamily ATP-dependent carboligase